MCLTEKLNRLIRLLEEGDSGGGDSGGVVGGDSGGGFGTSSDLGEPPLMGVSVLPRGSGQRRRRKKECPKEEIPLCLGG